MKEKTDNPVQEQSTVFTFETVVAPETVADEKAETPPSDLNAKDQTPQSSPGASDAESHAIWKPGQFVGKYEIVRKIGRGGMGEIYLARHRQLDSLRALKVLTDTHGSDQLFLGRFLREARMASRIRHPNVVEVMDVEHDQERNLYYIVMEYVDGGSLRQILKRQTLTLEQSVVIIRGVATALCVAVDHKIVHRDIKPDNIMFTRNGVVKLTDLGIAKSDVDDVNLTRTNVMIGTPAYLSPEQIDNPKVVDIRTDIYSLGATFYEMLTGRTPYPGKTTYDIMRRLFSDPVPDPRALNPAIPQEIAAVIMKMLAKNANERYRDPAELLAELSVLFPPLTAEQCQHIIQGLIGDGKKEGVSSDISKVTNSFYTNRSQAKKKSRIRLWTGIFLLMVTCGIIEYFVLNISSEETPPPPPKIKLEKLSVRTTPHAEVCMISSDGRTYQYIANDQGVLVIANLRHGKYQLEIRRTDFCDHVSEVQIPHKKELVVMLTPDLKILTVSAQPGARIALSGKGIPDLLYQVPSSGTLQIPELKKGLYSVRCTQEGYLPVEKMILLDQNESISINMESIYKSMLLNTAPSARIELRQNGMLRHRGTADRSGRCLISNIRKGIYEITISAESAQKYTSVITVDKDITSKISLLPRPVEKIPPKSVREIPQPVDLGSGIVSVDFVGDDKLLNYVRTEGIEIQFDDGKWTLVKKFPHQYKTIPGKVKVRIRGSYIYSLFPETVQVRNGKTAQYTTMILARPSKIVLSSNRSDTVFHLNGQTFSGNTSVDVDAFGVYTVEAVSGDMQQEKVLRVDRPNIKLDAAFFFETQVQPGENEYQEGIKLFEKKNYPKALKLLEHAAKKHHIPAALKVAEFHEKGLGSFLRISNHKEALKWFDIAAGSGDPGAAFLVAEEIRNENMDSTPEKMLKYYALAVANGNAQAAYIMATVYRNGYKTIAPEKSLMLKYLETAATRQHADAMYELGICYEQGDGMPANTSLALQWIRKSADAGNAKACRYLENVK